MEINKELLDGLTAQAKAAPRLRMNLDLRNSAEDGSQRILNIPAGKWHTLRSLESGTVILEMKDGAFEPIGPDDIMKL